MSRPDHQEGWAVPRRLPLITALLTLIVLTIALLLAGKFYVTHIAAGTRPPKLALPAPQLETMQIAPGERRPPRPAPPRGIDQAIAATARQGDALWGQGK